MVLLTTQRQAQNPNIKEHAGAGVVSVRSAAAASEARGELKVRGEKKNL